MSIGGETAIPRYDINVEITEIQTMVRAIVERLDNDGWTRERIAMTVGMGGTSTLRDWLSKVPDSAIWMMNFLTLGGFWDRGAIVAREPETIRQLQAAKEEAEKYKVYFEHAYAKLLEYEKLSAAQAPVISTTISQALQDAVIISEQAEASREVDRDSQDADDRKKAEGA
jgi:hypothetical protein